MTYTNKDIVVLSSHDWQEYKDIRLTLLKEYPHAFSAELNEELLLTDAQWQERLNQQNALFVGIKDSENNLIALAGAQLYKGARVAHKAQLISIGAHPACENAVETLTILLKEFLVLLKNRGIVQITTTINENAQSAQDVYKKLGFNVVGTLEKEILDNGKIQKQSAFLENFRIKEGGYSSDHYETSSNKA